MFKITIGILKVIHSHVSFNFINYKLIMLKVIPKDLLNIEEEEEEVIM